VWRGVTEVEGRIKGREGVGEGGWKDGDGRGRLERRGEKRVSGS
jgi:hypothetical protein